MTKASAPNAFAAPNTKGRARRVTQNLRKGMELAWSASPTSLVLLAVAAAVLSLALEHRVTSKMYAFFDKEPPEERVREYLGDLLVQPRTTKEIRAYVLSDYLLGRHKRVSEDLFTQREQMYQSGTRISLLTGLVSGTTLALAYVFVAISTRPFSTTTSRFSPSSR